MVDCLADEIELLSLRIPSVEQEVPIPRGGHCAPERADPLVVDGRNKSSQSILCMCASNQCVFEREPKDRRNGDLL